MHGLCPLCLLLYLVTFPNIVDIKFTEEKKEGRKEGRKGGNILVIMARM